MGAAEMTIFTADNQNNPIKNACLSTRNHQEIRRKRIIVDESGDGKINKAEMKKFLVFVNETQALGLPDKEVDALNDEIFSTLGKTELTLDDVRDVVAARW